jgi:hypothetical protein
MKYAVGLNAVLLVLVSFLTACDPDSSGETKVFLIESDETYEYPPKPSVQPKQFKGDVTGIEGKIVGNYSLGVIGSITGGKLRLALPAHIEDEHLKPFRNRGDIKYGEFGFSKGAILILSKNIDLYAELFYCNRDIPNLGIKEGWNFEYPDSNGSPIYTNDIKALYAPTPDTGYLWLVQIIPDN